MATVELLLLRTPCCGHRFPTLVRSFWNETQTMYLFIIVRLCMKDQQSFVRCPLIAFHNRGFPITAGAGLPGGHNRALLHRRPSGSPSSVSDVIRGEGRGRGCSGACMFPVGGDHALPLGCCRRGGQAADATPDQLSAGERTFYQPSSRITFLRS
jgi:hypothetical protein